MRSDEGTPLSLVGNGRNREPAADAERSRLATLHARATARRVGRRAHPGRLGIGRCRTALYTVTAVVGDAGTAVDSVHYLNIEDQNAVAAFVPTAAAKFATATRTVTVTDGRLTLSPTAGTNTKFDYVDVASVPAAARHPGGTHDDPGQSRHRRAADHQRGGRSAAAGRRGRPGQPERRSGAR